MIENLKPITETGYNYESDEGLVLVFTTDNPDYWVAIKPSGRKLICFSPTGAIKAYYESSKILLSSLT